MLRLLQASSRRLAFAESLTGGGLGARLTAIEGASSAFVGSAVVYTAEAKHRVLGVSRDTIEGPGVVSRACASEMAAGARRLYDVDVAVSLTGAAGPEPHGGADTGDGVGRLGCRRCHTRSRVPIDRRPTAGASLGRTSRVGPGASLSGGTAPADVGPTDLKARGQSVAPDRATNSDRVTRLFVGVPIPASVTRAIDDAIAPWRQRFPKARWVPSQERHVTLTFLGPTPEQLDDWVRDRSERWPRPSHPFDLQPGWPRRASLRARRAHVLWLGSTIERTPRGAGGHARGRPSPRSSPAIAAVHPARHRRQERSGPAVPTGLTEPDRSTSAAFSVREIVLYRSHAGTPGTRYEALASFTLGG